MKLTQGMFGREIGPKPITDFNLGSGQLRGGSSKVTHNSGWYNTSGEKIGWGDLSSNDFRRIVAELESDQVFIVMGEQDSFWNFVTKVGVVGATATVQPTAECPGTEYVLQHMSYFVTKEGVCSISHSSNAEPWQVPYEEGGELSISPITHSQALKIIKAHLWLENERLKKELGELGGKV